MSDTMRLVLLRHGESVWNKENLFTGWTDVDLSDKGREEARSAGRLMRDEGLDFDVCYTSFLKRAIHTLNLALEEMDREWLPVTKAWQLNERHYGALQGLNKADTAAKYGEEQVKAYVLDETCRKQPLGAWGALYIMDHPTSNWTDKITNPYGPGVLYQTGLHSRILPDGSLDILEQCGRTIMMETLTGRDFLDLGKLEQVLCGYAGVESAQAYIAWGLEHRMELCADIAGKENQA